MALFIDIADFRQDIPELHQAYTWSALKNRVDQITRTKIFPLIGEALYEDLETKYLASGLSALEEALVEKYLQPAIAAYSYISLLSTNRVQLGQMGVQENRSQDGTSNPVSFHALQDVKEEMAWLGYQLIDQALTYLDKEKANFSLWTAGEGTSRRECLVYDVETFNAHLPIGGSIQTYQLLRDSLMRIQTDNIQPEFSTAFWSAFITANKAGTYTEAQSAVLTPIRNYLTADAMLRQIPFVSAKMGTNGIWIRAELDGPQRKSASQKEQTAALTESLEKQKNAAWGKLITIFETDAETYGRVDSAHKLHRDGDYSHQLPDNSFKKSFRV